MRMELSQIKSFHFPMLRLSSKLYNFGIHFYLNLFISQSLICLMHSLADALFFRFFSALFHGIFQAFIISIPKEFHCKAERKFFSCFFREFAGYVHLFSIVKWCASRRYLPQSHSEWFYFVREVVIRFLLFYADIFAAVEKPAR